MGTPSLWGPSHLQQDGVDGRLVEEPLREGTRARLALLKVDAEGEARDVGELRQHEGREATRFYLYPSVVWDPAQAPGHDQGRVWGGAHLRGHVGEHSSERCDARGRAERRDVGVARKGRHEGRRDCSGRRRWQQ